MRTLLKLIAGATLVIIYRWTLDLSTPRRDWWYVVEYGQRATRFARRSYAMVRLWFISLIHYAPTTSVEKAWQALKDGLRQGKYGEAGT